MRRRYLVSYDISDDKRRTRVFRILMDAGDHAQYSVFFCELNAMELAEVTHRLKDAINHREDQVLILDLGTVENPLSVALTCIGKAYLPPERVFIV